MYWIYCLYAYIYLSYIDTFTFTGVLLHVTKNKFLFTLVYCMFIYFFVLLCCSFAHLLYFLWSIISLCFSCDEETSTPALHVFPFWGRSSEGRGVFVWVDFKYQQCPAVFWEITFCPFNIILSLPVVNKCIKGERPIMSLTFHSLICRSLGGGSTDVFLLYHC